MDADLKKQLSASIMRLRQKSPYFAVLVSYLKPVQVSEKSDLDTAATDGMKLYINKPWFLGLTANQRDGLLCHEVLHCALGHCWRVGSRIPKIWNIAADLVINLMVRDDAKLDLPPGGWIDDQFKGRSTEEVYAMLLADDDLVQKIMMSGWMQGEGNLGADVLPGGGDKGPDEQEKHWNIAKQTAAAISKLYGHGHGDMGIIAKLDKPQVDWRKLLWDELSFAPTDYKNYDRRFLGDEIYVENLEPEETLLDVGIYIDTSGSVVEIVGKFIAEVKSIHNMFPNVHIDMYWIDTDLIGPFTIEEVDKPQGGGGTDFRPAFVESEEKRHKTIIYLTDGYGAFPESAPCRTIWCVCPGGLEDEKFPFGQVVRIIE